MTNGPDPPAPALYALIARELATEVRTLDKILERYGVDEEDYRANIEANPYFRRLLEDYTKEWHSLGSTQKRVAFAALTALEEKLPKLAHRMGDDRSGLADAVSAAKLFKELAGIAPPSPGSGAAQGPAFSISINFGDRKIAVEATQRERAGGALPGDDARLVEELSLPEKPKISGPKENL